MTTLSTWIVEKGIISKMKVDQLFRVLIQESTSDHTQFTVISKILTKSISNKDIRDVLGCYTKEAENLFEQGDTSYC